MLKYSYEILVILASYAKRSAFKNASMSGNGSLLRMESHFVISMLKEIIPRRNSRCDMNFLLQRTTSNVLEISHSWTFSPSAGKIHKIQTT